MALLVPLEYLEFSWARASEKRRLFQILGVPFIDRLVVLFLSFGDAALSHLLIRTLKKFLGLDNFIVFLDI